MTMQYDVKSAYLTATGQFVVGRCRLKNVVFLPNGTAGSIVIYDGTDNTGPIVWQTKTLTGVQPFQLIVPGEGILATVGLYAVFTNISSATVLYG